MPNQSARIGRERTAVPTVPIIDNYLSHVPDAVAVHRSVFGPSSLQFPFGLWIIRLQFRASVVAGPAPRSGLASHRLTAMNRKPKGRGALVDESGPNSHPWVQRAVPD